MLLPLHSIATSAFVAVGCILIELDHLQLGFLLFLFTERSDKGNQAGKHPGAFPIPLQSTSEDTTLCFPFFPGSIISSTDV